MALVAWAPKGMAAPLELIAVRINPGQVTEREWIEALADRVQELANKAGAVETMQACRNLDVPEPEEIEEAGQALVLNNLNLRTNLNLAMPAKHPFPATAGEPAQELKDALELELSDWVEQALSLVSASSLD